MFSNMASAGSQMAGSITIDGTSYAITRRTGDNQVFGNFTIPEGYTAVFYALAVSSGGGDRQINLVSGDYRQELNVPGGSGAYQRLESEPLEPGTYSIEREGSSNVRLGIVVIRLIASGSGTGLTTPDAVPSAQKILREGRLLILRDGKVYDINGCLIY